MTYKLAKITAARDVAPHVSISSKNITNLSYKFDT